ncbi:MAG TPA: EAL domain-containing protein [Rudaea sp.]|nr:EAL domain-containing protein [Rudaea sp.]
MSLSLAAPNPKLREHALFALRLLLASALLSLVSYLAARAQPNQGYVPIWPSGGLGLALVWRHGAKYWPAVLAGNTALSMSVGTPILIAVGVGWLQVLIVMVALLLLQYWKVDRLLRGTQELARFILALLLATAIAVPVYGLRMWLVFAYPPERAIAFGVDYFLSALFSFLIFTPLVAAWPMRMSASRMKRWAFAGAMLFIAIAGWTVLRVDPAFQDRLLFLLLPFVVVCAVAAGIGGASAASALLAMFMIAMAQQPVPVADSILRSLFAVIATLTGYLLAVVFSEREGTASEMDYRARHDALTGLINRYEFDNRVNAALNDTSRRYAVLYLDLDQFKLVNDTCGHLAGDHMLRELAMTIERSLPRGAALARLGGDEFACLLPDATVDSVDEVARNLHDAVRAFEFPLGELRFRVGVSIGTTFLNAAGDRGSDDVLARADVACYVAKERGRNRTHAYDTVDANMHGRHSDIQKISQLQTELSAGLFQLYGQRIIDIGATASGEEICEVLLRHADPNGHWSIESVFESARRYGLTAQIDRWVLERAAQFLQSRPGMNVRLSINVSATTLESDGFREFVLALPERHGFRPRQLLLEITEAVAVQNLTRAVETLHTLLERGIEICLDDFGSGVASFGYLNDLPVSMVKLDGRFVRDIVVDPAAEIVIESLTRVAALRGITCVAEWVEDLEIIPRLRRLGVAYAQGHAIHRPAPLASVIGAAHRQAESRTIA